MRGFLRVRDTLCMSVVLSINTSETGLARNGSSVRGAFLSRCRDGLRFVLQRIKHDSALVHKGANGDTYLLTD